MISAWGVDHGETVAKSYMPGEGWIRASDYTAGALRDARGARSTARAFRRSPTAPRNNKDEWAARNKAARSMAVHTARSQTSLKTTAPSARKQQLSGHKLVNFGRGQAMVAKGLTNPFKVVSRPLGKATETGRPKNAFYHPRQRVDRAMKDYDGVHRLYGYTRKGHLTGLGKTTVAGATAAGIGGGVYGVKRRRVAKSYSPAFGWQALSKVPAARKAGFLRQSAELRSASRYDKPNHPYDAIDNRVKAAHKMDKFVNRTFHGEKATRPSARTQKQSGWSDYTMQANILANQRGRRVR